MLEFLISSKSNWRLQILFNY